MNKRLEKLRVEMIKSVAFTAGVNSKRKEEWIDFVNYWFKRLIIDGAKSHRDSTRINNQKGVDSLSDWYLAKDEQQEKSRLFFKKLN